LPLYKGFIGEAFPTTFPIMEHGLGFEVDIAEGHKTGFYLDQMDNHLLFRSLLPAGSTVLDAFCYTGAFAVYAAAAGASQVLGFDTSAAALAAAQRHAALNKVEPLCQFTEGNVFDHLRQLLSTEQRFDVIVLDPPSFTHRRDAIAKALSGYKEIHLRALKLLRPGGLLWTFTCSYYVQRLQFESMLQEAAGDARRQLIVRHRPGQALHHPEVLAIPETSYLKGLVAEVW
jgi:23S rRNA (cytosine1962-C5)-methyltransferase